MNKLPKQSIMILMLIATPVISVVRKSTTRTGAEPPMQEGGTLMGSEQSRHEPSMQEGGTLMGSKPDDVGEQSAPMPPEPVCVSGREFILTVTNMDNSPISDFRLEANGEPIHAVNGRKKSLNLPREPDYSPKFVTINEGDPEAGDVLYNPMNYRLGHPESAATKSQREWLSIILAFFNPYEDKEITRGSKITGTSYEELELEKVSSSSCARSIKLHPSQTGGMAGAGGGGGLAQTHAMTEEPELEVTMKCEGLDLSHIELKFGVGLIAHPHSVGTDRNCLKMGKSDVYFESKEKMWHDLFKNDQHVDYTTKAAVDQEFTWAVIPKTIAREAGILIMKAKDPERAGGAVIERQFRNVIFKDHSTPDQRSFEIRVTAK